MDLAVTTEQRLYRTPDRSFRASLLHGFWGRYRHTFSAVHLVARVFEGGEAEQRFGRVDEGGVTVLPLPPFDGLLSFAAAQRELRRRIEPLATSEFAVLLRLPSIYATRIGRRLARAGKPFGAEILGDPAEALARGSLRHPARMLLRRLLRAELRWACDRACATAYVTRSTLQGRYPPRSGRFTTHGSDIELADEDFAASPRARPEHEGIALVHVGTFSQPYKGQDLIVDAVRTLARRGVAVRATLIGEGRWRPALEARARERGLGASIEFPGEIRDRA